MKIKILSVAFLCFSLWSCSTSNFSPATNYAIIVDAGSSGSRVHLFSYESTYASNQNPAISEINFYKSQSNKSSIPITNTNLTSPGSALSTFEQPFNLALAYLKNHGIQENAISVYVYSTAGMRLLNLATRNQINDMIALTLRRQHHDYNVIDVKTISGQEEALYAWLDVNYLNGNIAPNPTSTHTTNGTIDVGGASTQIAYETSAQTASNYKITHVNVFGKTYNLYLNSILGGGQDQVRGKMILDFSNSNVANACYIAGSDSNVPNAAFNDALCFDKLTHILSSSFARSENPANKALLPVPPSETNFVALSSAYFAYQFFGATINSNVPVQSLQTNYQNHCYASWATFQTAFPTAKRQFLAQQCADSVYIYNLLTTGAYHLTNGSAITVSTADWTEGAMLMISSGKLLN